MAVFIFNREENFLAAIGDREMKNADTNDVGYRWLRRREKPVGG